MAMSKGQLAAAVAETTGCTKKMAGDALDAVLAAITKELAAEGQVTITGFGTFRVSHRAARTGVNPQNPSQKIQIPATKVPTFKAGKNLKDAVRNS
jgi:nucleoid DNA-binding protein